VGAGAGGFLLFLAEDPKRLRSAMAEQGLKEVRFRFDLDGTTVVARG
jgi:D-glycero-alpha-D-manno-heptose-7-phosphate kinase